MERRTLRAILVVLVLATVGWLMGDAAKRGNVILFTVEAIVATAIVTAITAALGPVQKADERMIVRSKDAALIAVRVSTIVGLITGAYANILGYAMASAFFAGMVVPGIVWSVAYFALNWRDVDG